MDLLPDATNTEEYIKYQLSSAGSRQKILEQLNSWKEGKYRSYQSSWFRREEWLLHLLHLTAAPDLEGKLLALATEALTSYPDPPESLERQRLRELKEDKSGMLADAGACSIAVDEHKCRVGVIVHGSILQFWQKVPEQYHDIIYAKKGKMPVIVED